MALPIHIKSTEGRGRMELLGDDVVTLGSINRYQYIPAPAGNEHRIFLFDTATGAVWYRSMGDFGWNTWTAPEVKSDD